MLAGQLRHTVTIQRVAKTQNSYGEDLSTWSDIGTFPAWVYSLQGRELESMRQTWADARFGVDMRHQPEIVFRREDRVFWVENSEYLDVLDVQDPDGRKRSLHFICREFVQ